MYWKGKLLNVQEIVSITFLPSIFITLSINIRWELVGRIGVDVDNSPGFMASGTWRRLFDWLDLAVLTASLQTVS